MNNTIALPLALLGALLGSPALAQVSTRSAQLLRQTEYPRLSQSAVLQFQTGRDLVFEP